jgi:hypothetical protein
MEKKQEKVSVLSVYSVVKNKGKNEVRNYRLTTIWQDHHI